ncbi:MAG: small multi-drug export protein [Candidatus Komeilibacteria bacterium]|nr:small multi-drug export protein [Candidatus Komeilibacteria bacterium]
MTELFLLLQPYLKIFWLAMLPATELRAAIPLGLIAWQLDPWLTYFVAIIGNFIPALVLIVGLEKADKIMHSRDNWITRLYHRYVDHLRGKAAPKVAKYGYFALLLFVALPVPGTGAWSGTIISWLFGMRKGKSLSAIGIGIMIAGVIVTLFSTGIIKFI